MREKHVDIKEEKSCLKVVLEIFFLHSIYSHMAIFNIIFEPFAGG
jgi:hypothetical protein